MRGRKEGKVVCIRVELCVCVCVSDGGGGGDGGLVYGEGL